MERYRAFVRVRLPSTIAGAVASAMALALAGATAGCNAPVEPAAAPEANRCAFERDVYPVLARDCGFPACHGDTDRFFRVYAPGRTRLDPDTGPFAAPTGAEIDATFERARSMLAGVPSPDESLLLRKPLAPEAGGASHEGTDAFERDVYPSRDAAGWQALATWARGRSEEPCP